jgi:hypothetical protein
MRVQLRHEVVDTPVAHFVLVAAAACVAAVIGQDLAGESLDASGRISLVDVPGPNVLVTTSLS